MPADGGEEVDPWDRFGQALDLVRNRLDAARNRYEGLVEMNEAPPDGYASALRELEADIEAIDDILDVSEDEAAEAEGVAERAELLADVLDAAWTFHTSLLDAELDVYRTWHASLERTGAVDCSEATAELTSLTELASNENYTQLRTGEQFTLGSFRGSLVVAEEAASESIPSDEYVQRCLELVEEYQGQFTEDLKRLVSVGADVQIKSDRTAVDELTDVLDDEVDEGDLDADSVVDARCAMEGAMMLKYYTAYALRAHTYCERLAEVLNRIDGAATPDEDLIDSLAVDEFTGRVEDAIVEAATKTDAERVVDLLQENDRSLTAALGASEMNAETFFGAVRTAFEDDQITDIEVSFE